MQRLARKKKFQGISNDHNSVLKVIVTVRSSGCLNSTDRFGAPGHRLYLQLFDLTTLNPVIRI